MTNTSFVSRIAGKDSIFDPDELFFSSGYNWGQVKADIFKVIEYWADDKVVIDDNDLASLNDRLKAYSQALTEKERVPTFWRRHLKGRAEEIADRLNNDLVKGWALKWDDTPVMEREKPIKAMARNLLTTCGIGRDHLVVDFADIEESGLYVKGEDGSPNKIIISHKARDGGFLAALETLTHEIMHARQYFIYECALSEIEKDGSIKSFDTKGEIFDTLSSINVVMEDFYITPQDNQKSYEWQMAEVEAEQVAVQAADRLRIAFYGRRSEQGWRALAEKDEGQVKELK